MSNVNPRSNSLKPIPPTEADKNGTKEDDKKTIALEEDDEF